MTEKKLLRKEMRNEIARKINLDFTCDHLEACLKAWTSFKNKTVALYCADPQELDLLSLFPESQILLPRFKEVTKLYDFSLWSGKKEDLREGPFGILEPRKLEELDVIDFCFIPGIAFDRVGNRLGRGGGFYDRLLAKYAIGTKVGVCHDFQLLGKIPKEEHDYVMDFLLSPSGLIKCDRKQII
ncbi:5-formyltetrahydrofolate cyclo-ligase [Lentisphaera profundi]|uniref:5-formyltetrahydrofolate cyclo-ligase n=1 Tax=Lentisphaera profundi TaxID=1658616 RepID=A0ABY7VY16_9BACT|nr:5-formyltetrahydrofolate cyclo-ligase [Lentisphaera profundi]WDE98168.1 5-formyltetrahydrofolate cyclo-ligase [Lentisphaera profundi]